MSVIPSNRPFLPLAGPLAAAASGQAQATVASSQSFTLTVTTRDGDTVTISALQNAAATATTSKSALAFQAQEIEGMGVVVRGELDAEELAALAALIDDLAEVGRAFYAGDAEAAMAQALALPDYAPLASFTATFVRSEYVRLQGQHPLPAGLATPPPTDGLPPAPPQVADASWQEAGAIIERLRQATQAQSAASPPPMTDLPAAGDLAAFVQAVHDRLRSFLSAQPRLAPVLPAATAEGLDQVARELPPSIQQAARRFHGQLVRGVADWLFGVPA
ncbi:MAG TPA: hypothetical protein ENJ73_00415 [Desulfobacterales bacterium]|nr:hypothetical protein [Desulfobacterales bacterium]